MKVSKIFSLLAVVLLISTLAAKAGVYEDYIERYSGMAMQEQTAAGIPASITLAQGLLESSAGRSTLATRGNNHFGIKCHSDWEGDTLLRSDDAPDECFRCYADASESFRDHSRFLQRKRYESLFRLPPTDYAAWAAGLSKCGYATDPNYASRLISIIERYALFLYDTPGGHLSEDVADFISTMLRDTHPVRRSRGLHYVIASPGDTYGSIAKELGMNKKKLMEYNDARRDDEIKEWEEVYLEPKRDEAPEKVESATIGEGESMHSISQRYGIKLARLRQLNPDAEDSPGSRLRLR